MRRARFAAVMVGAGLLLAACGSNGYGSGSSPSATKPAVAAGPAALEVLDSKQNGQVMTSGGYALYVFTKDEGAPMPTCTGDCSSLWPPLLTAGMPTGASGINASQLSMVTRDDGRQQVAYEGRPLYFYAPDKVGETKGQGVGGTWFLISPAGSVMRTDAGTATTAASGGYGYGY